MMGAFTAMDLGAGHLAIDAYGVGSPYRCDFQHALATGDGAPIANESQHLLSSLRWPVPRTDATVPISETHHAVPRGRVHPATWKHEMVNIGRRSFLAGSGAATLARPALGQSMRSRTLRIVPQADLANLDPVWTTAVVTTSHGYAIFDTLYALDGHALLLTLYNTGARVSEIIALRREQVRLDSAGAHVELLGKGRKERVVPLWADTAQVLRAWFRELGDDDNGVAFPGVRGPALSRDGVDHLLRRAVVTAAAACPSLGVKKVSPHVPRHSTAMHLFRAGVDMAVIALWLGHESLETTHVYVEADLATKERALEKLAPMPGMPARYRADDKLLAFLAAL
jgi:hypothetical protein